MAGQRDFLAIRACRVDLAEFAEGLAPKAGLLSLRGGRVGPSAWWFPAAGQSLVGALVFDVDDGEPEQLDDGHRL